MKTITVSTVTPVYSGEKYLEELVDRIAAVRAQWEEQDRPCRLIESIFVVDDAIDGSDTVLRRLAGRYDWLHIVHMSRNFGQHPATMAGILYTSGDWVITLDEDLQHDPDRFIDLLKSAVAGALDAVYAEPCGQVHGSGGRDFFSRRYKALMAWVLGNPHIPKFNSFRLIRGAIARAAASVCSHETYFDIALCWFTNRIGTAKFPVHDRRHEDGGRSGYSMRSLFAHARRLVVSSRANILRVGAWIGGMAMALSIVATVVFVFIKMFAPEMIKVQGWTSLALMTLFFGGLTSLLLSVVLEFLMSMSLHTQGKPTFLVVDRGDDELLKKAFAGEDRAASE